MKEVGITKLMNSPLLLLVMLCFLGAVSLRLYKTFDASSVPDLPGYQLSKQKEAVVICYRPGCGCEAHTVFWAEQALNMNKTTVVMSNHSQPDVEFIRSNMEEEARLFIRMWPLLLLSVLVPPA